VVAVVAVTAVHLELLEDLAAADLGIAEFTPEGLETLEASRPLKAMLEDKAAAVTFILVAAVAVPLG
jgi:hypothetical protein